MQSSSRSRSSINSIVRGIRLLFSLMCSASRISRSNWIAASPKFPPKFNDGRVLVARVNTFNASHEAAAIRPSAIAIIVISTIPP